jgi:hypothetical protein
LASVYWLAKVRGYEIAQLTVGGEESDSGTLAASTSCSANAVNIVLRIVGIVVVQNVSDISNILKWVSNSAVRTLTVSSGGHVWPCDSR